MIRIDVTIDKFLTAVFIVLKLSGVLSWNWVLVFSPMLIKLALVFIVLGLTYKDKERSVR